MFIYPKIARGEIFHLPIILNILQITNLGTELLSRKLIILIVYF